MTCPLFAYLKVILRSSDAFPNSDAVSQADDSPTIPKSKRSSPGNARLKSRSLRLKYIFFLEIFEMFIMG